MYPPNSFWETWINKNSLGKSSIGKPGIGKSGKIRVTVDVVVCFHVCRELDNITLIAKNQPVLLLVTDICLLSCTDKSVSPSHSKATLLLWGTSGGLGSSASRQGPLSASYIYLLHMCKGPYCLPSDALCRTVLIPQPNRRDPWSFSGFRAVIIKL